MKEACSTPFCTEESVSAPFRGERVGCRPALKEVCPMPFCGKCAGPFRDPCLSVLKGVCGWREGCVWVGWVRRPEGCDCSRTVLLHGVWGRESIGSFDPSCRKYVFLMCFGKLWCGKVCIFKLVWAFMGLLYPIWVCLGLSGTKASSSQEQPRSG